jgi:hypothetical protein
MAAMVREAEGRPGLTFIDLEFDTSKETGTPLGDIASSLITLNDLLRDLATLAAYPSSVEFREIQVVAVEMRSPLKITLSLLAISPEAVKAFQEICRDIIFFRERRASARGELDEAATKRAAAALDLILRADGKDGHLTEREAQRLRAQIATLQDAEVPLKRVVVKEQ